MFEIDPPQPEIHEQDMHGDDAMGASLEQITRLKAEVHPTREHPYISTLPPYRGTLLIRNSAQLGPYSSNVPMALWRPSRRSPASRPRFTPGPNTLTLQPHHLELKPRNPADPLISDRFALASGASNWVSEGYPEAANATTETGTQVARLNVVANDSVHSILSIEGKIQKSQS